jgi:glycosyltransferase involved in cell wall biosynthesis
MRCPTLKELPPPPPGRTGWPWTEESPQMPDTMPDDSSWPRFTIVTPTLNQGKFIEETIRSVLLQGYPNLEYFIIDGGSKDETVDIIKKYEKWLTNWVSEPDRGQAHAINKGFQRATGEIIAFLNSDDTYKKNILCIPAKWLDGPEEIHFIYGDCDVVNAKGEKVDFYKGKLYRNQDFRAYWNHYVPQPSAFFLRSIFDDVGLLDEDLNFVMDYDFWLRCSRKYFLYYIGEVMANFRLHGTSKTVSLSSSFDVELDRAVKRYWGSQLSITFYYYLFRRNSYRSGVLRTHAYSSLRKGDHWECTSYLVKALLYNPLFFLNKKYFSIQNLKTKYLPFILDFVLPKPHRR